MKTQLYLVALPLLSSIILHPASLLAQGSLTPPGAPVETMKSLDQIYARTDARIPISAAPLTISNSGSYYLTTNLTVTSGDAITIATNGVTLDLNGFTISSTAASAAGSAILLNSALRNITITNGFIESGVTNNGSGVFSGSGFGYGIYYSGNAPRNVLVSRVSVAGCLYYGIFLDTFDSTVVESCTVGTVGSFGIVASTIKQSAAKDCVNHGIIGDQVSDCWGESSGGYGVNATTALNCYGYSSGSGRGVTASTALNCYGYSSSSHGVYATTAQNCYGQSGGNGYGVNATTAQNCYGYSSSGYGVAATTALNCFGHSSGGGNGVNATIAQNCYGESTSGYGVYAGTADSCFGTSISGTGLYAFIASVCRGATSTGTGLNTPHNINSF